MAKIVMGVGTLLMSKSDQEYLRKCANQMHFAYGIIIGQRVHPNKYIVVHLAKNGEEDIDLHMALEDGAGNIGQGPQKIEEIDLQALTNQWLCASKMIPGSFTILGVFIASLEEFSNSESSPEWKSAKRLLYDIHNLLKQGNQFNHEAELNTEYIFLFYSCSSDAAFVKYYNYVANGGTFTAMDCRIVEKPFEWYAFECNYELDDVFPILTGYDKINIETHFRRTIDSVRSNLNASEIFIQNENVEDGEQLAVYANRLQQTQRNSPIDDYLRATIFLPIKCLMSKLPNPIQVREFNGTIRLFGVITSRIWSNPKNTLGVVKQFIREDILRSLVARIQVYCDGLTDPNVSTESMFISEPPRRVYFHIAIESHLAIPIQFSDYIFRGEAATVAVAQAKQILDLELTTENIISDWEGVMDDDCFSDNYSDTLETTKQKLIAVNQTIGNTQELSRAMYMLGISVALLVLVLSIVIHYIVT